MDLFRDRRGRRRQPGQQRGLRPIFPPLEQGWASRVLRVAMPVAVWHAFERLVEHFPAETQARAHGEAIRFLLRFHERETARWLDWDQRKHERLLGSRGPRAALNPGLSEHLD